MPGWGLGRQCDCRRAVGHGGDAGRGVTGTHSAVGMLKIVNGSRKTRIRSLDRARLRSRPSGSAMPGSVVTIGVAEGLRKAPM